MHRMRTGLRQVVTLMRYGGAHNLLPAYRARRVPSTKWHVCVRRQKQRQPDFEKYFEEVMDSLTGEEIDALLPTEQALR